MVAVDSRDGDPIESIWQAGMVGTVTAVVIASLVSVWFARGRVREQVKAGFASLCASFAATNVFRNAVKKTFEEIDEDANGTIDANELYIGVLLIFDRLNSALPYHEHPPTRADVLQMLSNFDASKDGALDFNEFETLATGLIDPRKGKGTSTRAIVPAICRNLLVTAVVLPACAYITRTAVASCLSTPFVNSIPIACISPLLAFGCSWFIESSKQITGRKVVRE